MTTKTEERKKSYALRGPRGTIRRYFGTVDKVGASVFQDLVELWSVKGDALKNKALLDVVDIMKKGRLNWSSLGWTLTQV